MNILILGSTGQVGFELQRTLPVLGKVIAPDRHILNLHDAAAVDQYLAQQQPDLIVNAAAYTAVDNAESETLENNRLNTELPAQLAAYASKYTIPLVHYSTDYVYTGTGNSPHTERSAVGPLSAYGQAKLAGDLAISQSGCDHMIFRTSWVYSARGNNFMKTMLRLARERDALSVVADQIGAPTPARLIAQITTMAIYRHRHKAFPGGTYHLVTRGETSWHAFAAAIIGLADQQGEQLRVTATAINPIKTAEYPTPARRPLNSRLNVTKLEAALGLQLPDWHSQLQLTLKEYLS